MICSKVSFINSSSDFITIPLYCDEDDDFITLSSLNTHILFAKDDGLEGDRSCFHLVACFSFVQNVNE